MARIFFVGGLFAIAAVSLAYAEDGEGTARVVAPGHLIAGSHAQVIVELTVGPSGIPAGGGVSIGLHHAAQWPGLQCNAPDRPGYVAVRGETPGNFEVTWHGWIPAEAIEKVHATGFSDSICHQVAMARVTKQAIEPGTRITFVIGANEHKAQVQKSADRDHEFHVMTDADGDGLFRGIEVQPRLDILAGPAHHLALSVPATLVVGEPFDMQVRAEDQYFNPAGDFSGRVVVGDQEDAGVAETVALEGGLGHVMAAVDSPGPHRFRAAAGALRGRSNPCRAFGEAPPLRIFWGDIHGHTSISDGLGANAAEYFAFGRDVADLDVCALTDHGHFDWPQTIEAVKQFHEPGRYVTLLAQEAGAGSDHMNYYFRGDETPHVNKWTTDYAELYAIIYEQYNSGQRPGVITGPHHFTYDRGDDRYPFGLFDTRTARFVEVYSSHGTSEYLGNPRPCAGATDERKFLQHGLAEGLRFGVIGSSDNHDSHPGRSIWGHYPGGLVAFLAPELTREAIWDALWIRRVYAASFDRVYMEFTVNGQPMGGEVAADGPIRVSYYVIGRDDGVEVHLIRNNEEHRVDATPGSVVDISFEETPPEGESFYYLRVVQKNGERAWSTPIWVTRK
jgi:hypothetical protein